MASQVSKTQPEPAPRGWRFWAIFSSLCVANIVIALEGTITATAMPFIAADLGAGKDYVWFLNAYLLTFTVCTPFYGRLSYLYGHRWPAIIAVVIFILGSGISGGAKSTAMLIVGRLIQGAGGGGISATSTIIISELTSLRERGKFSGILFGVFGLGIAVGPPIGGFIVQNTNWRWIFWLNIPIGGVALVMLFLFLHTPFYKVPTIKFDLMGNFILVGSIVSILLALSWADTQYSWSSWQVLVPFIIGLCGIVLFHVWESKCATMPIVPSRLFSNRTSTIAFFNTFMGATFTVWRLFFISVYLQGVLLASPGVTGVLLLPSVLIFVPASTLSGFTLAKFGRYKPIHIFGFILTTLAVGLYINLDENWSTAKIVVYQLIAGLGSGVLVNTTLSAAQAALEPADALAAAAFYAYIRAFGSVWGVAIPAAIFNSCFANYSGMISDDAVRQLLSGGNAYSHVSSAYVSSLPGPVQREVIQAYLAALKVLWEVCLGFTAVSLLLTFFEKEIAMRTTLDRTHRESNAQSHTKDEESAVTSPEHFSPSEGGD